MNKFLNLCLALLLCATANGQSKAVLFTGQPGAVPVSITGGATVASTTNILAGDGAGNAVSSGIAAANVALLGSANTFTAKQTITQASANAGIVSSTGYSLTGSNATNMLDFAGTWNTSGAPTALKISITNTASNASSKLINVLAGSAGTTSYFSVDASGNIDMSGGAYTAFNGTVTNLFNTKLVSFRTGAGSSTDVTLDRVSSTLLELSSTNAALCTTSTNCIDFRARYHVTTVGSNIASASTIAPAAGVTHVTGTTTIDTITAPTNLALTNTGGCIILVPDGLWSTSTSGNIALATVGIVNKALQLCYDNGTSKWYPSY